MAEIWTLDKSKMATIVPKEVPVINGAGIFEWPCQTTEGVWAMSTILIKTN